MDEWLDLRRNFEAYSDFYTYMIKAIVGKRNFKKRLLNIAEGAEIATISDEALALVAIENCREVWDDVYKRSDGLIRQIGKDETGPPEWKSDFLPLYTRASKDDPSSDQNSERKSWSEAGIVRFNELHALIKADRDDHPNFKLDWLRQARAAIKDSEGTTLDPAIKTVEAVDDFQVEGETAETALNDAANQEGVAEAQSDADTETTT